MDIKISTRTPIEDKVMKCTSIDDIRCFIVAQAYKQGVVSSLEACDIINISRRAFEEMLVKYGVSPLRDTQENLDIELLASKGKDNDS